MNVVFQELQINLINPHQGTCKDESVLGLVSRNSQSNRVILYTVCVGGKALSDNEVMLQRSNLADKPRKINTAGTSNADVPLAGPGMYQLDITLRRGQSLAARDRGGTSDPYVKFKIGGREVFRSKIVHKNLNPVWEEKACLLVDHLKEPLYIKVFDYDFGLQDDFMGSAFLDLTQLELNR
ncbi:hypothetical protein E2I00_010830 [Balaenoptera physalus]|uniref:C2 domain-containing protein n=1 Tax=Balaenoptera physalus TaxID=9770 RepID=A0A6A1Q9R8_BALPH|nr:hypothetical protein E2I00_010830 [Balaenoptera physalus]